MRWLFALLLVSATTTIACDEANKAAPRSCIGSGCVVVTTGRYNPDFTGVGTLNTIELPGKTVTTAIDATLDPDVDLAVRGEEAVVLNRTTGTLRLYNARSWQVLAEASAGDTDHPAAASLPTSLHWKPDSLEVFVAFSGNDKDHAIGVVDLAQPAAGVERWISVAPDAADVDGKPEMSTFYACKDKLYVLAQNYSVDFAAFTVTYYPARIVQIDRKAPGAVERTISLVGKNPTSITAAGAGCDKVFVSTSDNLSTAPDGKSGIESVDLSKDASSGFLLTDQQIDGRATSVVGVTSSLAFLAQWTDLKPNDMGFIYLSAAKVVAFNPETKTLIGDVTKKAGNIAFLKLSPDNQLFVGTGLFNNMEEAGTLKRGLYFGPADGSGLPQTPIDLIDTPSGIAFEE